MRLREGSRAALPYAPKGEGLNMRKQLAQLNKRATCPKCRHRKVNIYYDEGRDVTSPCFLKHKGEHFDRRCLLCGYEWMEAVPARHLS